MCEPKERKYIVDTQTIGNSGAIDPIERLNAITFTNKGAGTLKIDGFELATGEFLTNNGLRNEIDETRYRVKWDSSVVPADRELVVRMKGYKYDLE